MSIEINQDVLCEFCEMLACRIIVVCCNYMEIYVNGAKLCVTYMYECKMYRELYEWRKEGGGEMISMNEDIWECTSALRGMVDTEAAGTQKAVGGE